MRRRRKHTGMWLQKHLISILLDDVGTHVCVVARLLARMTIRILTVGSGESPAAVGTTIHVTYIKLGFLLQ
jgi:hypothetical protein